MIEADTQHARERAPETARRPAATGQAAPATAHPTGSTTTAAERGGHLADDLSGVLARAVQQRAILQRFPHWGDDLALEDDDLDEELEEELDEEAARYLYKPDARAHRHTLGQHLNQLAPIKAATDKARQEAQATAAADADAKAQLLATRQRLRDQAIAAHKWARAVHDHLPLADRQESTYAALWQTLLTTVRTQSALPDAQRNWAKWLADATACTQRVEELRRQREAAEQARRTKLNTNPRQLKAFQGALEALLAKVPETKGRSDAAKRKRALRNRIEALKTASSDGFSIIHEEERAAVEREASSVEGTAQAATGSTAKAPIIPTIERSKVGAAVTGRVHEKALLEASAYPDVLTTIFANPSGGRTFDGHVNHLHVRGNAQLNVLYKNDTGLVLGFVHGHMDREMSITVSNEEGRVLRRSVADARPVAVTATNVFEIV